MTYNQCKLGKKSSIENVYNKIANNFRLSIIKTVTLHQNFKRNNKTVSPTASGKKIIRQAETALQEIDRISEIVMEEKGEIGGMLSLAVGPTIAPYILPKFIRHYRENYPSVDLCILELKKS